MTDDRLDQLSQVEDAETTLRDHQHPADEPIELSASDLVALDPDEPDEPEAEATLVIERSAIEEASKADATKEDLPYTAQNEAVDAMTAERSIPDELLNKSLRTRERRRVELSEPADPEHGKKTLKFEAIGGPKTEKMQAVGTQPLPRMDDDPETTAVRNTDGGVWAELDEDGFFTFMARPDAEGRIKLPSVVFGERDPAEGVMMYVRVKNLAEDLSAE